MIVSTENFVPNVGLIIIVLFSVRTFGLLRSLVLFSCHTSDTYVCLLESNLENLFFSTSGIISIS